MNKSYTKVDGKFYKKCKVVVIPAKNSNLLLGTIAGKSNQLMYYKGAYIGKSNIFVPQHLYILSNDEIKEGDWIYNSIRKLVFKISQEQIDYREIGDNNFLHKIIASTDPELTVLGNTEKGFNTYSDVLPRPSEAFLKRYCEKGGIEEVLIEYQQKTVWLENNDGPGESQYYCYEEDKVTPKLELKIAPDNTITIKPIKDNWNRKELFEEIRKFSSWKTRSFTSEDIKWIEENL